MQVLLEGGTDEQLSFFLPRVLAGARLGNAVAERNLPDQRSASGPTRIADS